VQVLRIIIIRFFPALTTIEVAIFIFTKKSVTIPFSDLVIMILSSFSTL
jgi:hypothetical protein